MATMRRTIARGIMFKGMNAKQKKMRRYERKYDRMNPERAARRAVDFAVRLHKEG